MLNDKRIAINWYSDFQRIKHFSPSVIDITDSRRQKGEKVFPDDGTPAIVSNTYGKGKTVYYASVLGSAYDPDAGEAFRQELVSRLSAIGLKPGWKIGGGCDASNKNIYVCPRALADGSTLLFILNMDDRASEFTVALPGVSQCRELGCSEAQANCFADGKFTLKLGDWGWSIWVCR